MGMGKLALGCGCCCNCDGVGLWACHGGLVNKVDGGALFQYPLVCCVGFRVNAHPTDCGSATFTSTGAYYTDACCQTNTDRVCGTRGATLFLRVISFTDDAANCCRIWTVDVAVTCNAVGGIPVIPTPGAYSRRTVAIPCEGNAQLEMGWQLGPVDLACSGAQPGIPILFGNHSGITCGCS